MVNHDDHLILPLRWGLKGKGPNWSFRRRRMKPSKQQRPSQIRRWRKCALATRDRTGCSSRDHGFLHPKIWWLHLVGGDWIFFFSFPFIGNAIIPTEFRIFQRGWNHQPVMVIYLQRQIDHVISVMARIIMEVYTWGPFGIQPWEKLKIPLQIMEVLAGARDNHLWIENCPLPCLIAGEVFDVPRFWHSPFFRGVNMAKLTHVHESPLELGMVFHHHYTQMIGPSASLGISMGACKPQNNRESPLAGEAAPLWEEGENMWTPCSIL